MVGLRCKFILIAISQVPTHFFALPSMANSPVITAVQARAICEQKLSSAESKQACLANFPDDRTFIDVDAFENCKRTQGTVDNECIRFVANWHFHPDLLTACERLPEAVPEISKSTLYTIRLFRPFEKGIDVVRDAVRIYNATIVKRCLRASRVFGQTDNIDQDLIGACFKLNADSLRYTLPDTAPGVINLDDPLAQCFLYVRGKTMKALSSTDEGQKCFDLTEIKTTSSFINCIEKNRTIKGYGNAASCQSAQQELKEMVVTQIKDKTDKGNFLSAIERVGNLCAPPLPAARRTDESHVR